MSNLSAYEKLKKHCELYPEDEHCKLLEECSVECEPVEEPGDGESPYENRDNLLYEIAEHLLFFTRQGQELQASHYNTLATLSKSYKEFPQLTNFLAQRAFENAPETDYFIRSTALQLQADAFRQQNLFEQADQAFVQAQSLIALERLQLK